METSIKIIILLVFHPIKPPFVMVFHPIKPPFRGNVNPGLINHGLLIRGVPLQ